MIRILTFTLLLLMALSCSKDRKIAPDEPVAPRLTGLLKTVTMESSSGHTVEEYFYTDSLTLKSIHYTRNGQNLIETFEYEKDTLRTSRAGDTLKKYIYRNGKLEQIEKHVTGKAGTYTVVTFNYSDAKVNHIEERMISSAGLSHTYRREYLLIWRGENISMFRERFSDGSVEDYDFQYSESRNPYSRLYSETLRIPAENPHFLSYHTPSGYSSFFAGKKYRIEGKYLLNRLPLREIISELNGDEWMPVKQYIFEYYE